MKSWRHVQPVRKPRTPQVRPDEAGVALVRPRQSPPEGATPGTGPAAAVRSPERERDRGLSHAGSQASRRFHPGTRWRGRGLSPALPAPRGPSPPPPKPLQLPGGNLNDLGVFMSADPQRLFVQADGPLYLAQAGRGEAQVAEGAGPRPDGRRSPARSLTACS